MSQIVLDDKLKFLITGLTLEHRGELFTSILEKNLTSTNKEIVGVYQYIMSLQKDIEQKKTAHARNRFQRRQSQKAKT